MQLTFQQDAAHIQPSYAQMQPRYAQMQPLSNPVMPKYSPYPTQLCQDAAHTQPSYAQIDAARIQPRYAEMQSGSNSEMPRCSQRPTRTWPDHGRTQGGGWGALADPWKHSTWFRHPIVVTILLAPLYTPLNSVCALHLWIFFLCTPMDQMQPRYASHHRCYHKGLSNIIQFFTHHLIFFSRSSFYHYTAPFLVTYVFEKWFYQVSTR